MSHVTTHHFSFPRTSVTENVRMPLRLTAIVTGLLLTLMSLLIGCGSGGETGSDPLAAQGKATASLVWDPVQDPSIMGYFVHYGRQSPHHSGSCAYEHSTYSADADFTITHLDPNTRYYFVVSAYNGLESACSHEVSIITPAASA
ncbi:MAG: fibronectin type III domain-containing protein [Nitrospirota bacterium]